MNLKSIARKAMSAYSRSSGSGAGPHPRQRRRSSPKSEAIRQATRFLRRR